MCLELQLNTINQLLRIFGLNLTDNLDKKEKHHKVKRLLQQ